MSSPAMPKIHVYDKEFEEGEIIATSEFGHKIIVVGTAMLGTKLDLSVKVMKPDGTFRGETPVALQRLLKFSSCKWTFIEK
jgi:hypothetical protein